MSDPVRDLFAEVKMIDAEADRIYSALAATRKLNDHRILTYRCRARRCLLLDFVQVPGAVVVHSPAYRLSPSLNASTSNEDGRAKNTFDGDRRWKAHTYDARSALNFVLNCDHVRGIVLEKSAVQADLDTRHSQFVVSASGERYPS